MESEAKTRKVFFFHVRVVSLFLGVIAFNFLIYGGLSPYWFVISSRRYSFNPELRVLGLSAMLEGHAYGGLQFFWDGSVTKERLVWKLSERRDAFCDRNSSRGLAALGALDGLDGLGHATNASCDIDCMDMRLLDKVVVPCATAKSDLAIPIIPAERVRQTKRVPPSSRSNQDLTLRFGCDVRIDEDTVLQCPVGFLPCPRETWRLCESQYQQWAEPACCVDTAQIGETLYNVSKAPTYLQVYSWAQWQVRSLKDSATSPEDSGTSTRSDPWCTVRDLRCHSYDEFTANGDRCLRMLVVSGGLLLVAFLSSLSRLKRQLALLSAACYALSGVLTIVAHVQYTSATIATVSKTTTPLDVWGRPYVHSMLHYNSQGRDIVLTAAGRGGAAEFEFYRHSARMDFTTAEESQPTPLTPLWGSQLCLLSGVVALLASVACLEMSFVLRGRSPVYWLLLQAGMLICLGPACVKDFIDRKLAPHAVLKVYPWQKLYARAFEAGTWTRCPFDQLYDYVLMLPIHVIRAVWDYVSCQDICAPAEKEVLRRHGICNDRVQSLMCSRRSYLTVTTFLGLIVFIMNLDTVVNLSNKVTYLRQGIFREVSFPVYRCNWNEGDCELGVPDGVAMGSYLVDMAIRVVSIVQEESNYIETLKALIQWMGGFIALCCSAAGLIYWTDYALSRKLVILGWLFKSMTPVLTSAFCENTAFSRPAVEEAIISAGVETLEEIRFFATSRPCEHVKTFGEQMLDKGLDVCGYAATFEVVIPDSILEACRQYKVYYDKNRNTMFNNATLVCESSLTMVEMLPKSRDESRHFISTYTGQMVDALQLWVGLRSGIRNTMLLIPAVLSLVPALMQGGLMLKNLAPRQSLGSILATLPWAFTTLFWSQWQVYYQLLAGKLFLLAALGLSYAPLVYYFFTKYYRIVQPMDDQQSITLTFRIWYYSLVFAYLAPYTLMVIYVTWLNSFMSDFVFHNTIGWLLTPTPSDLLLLVAGFLSTYTYTLQAGIDWFVGELTEHHVAANAPIILASTRTIEEAAALQARMGTTIDLEAINNGTYVCGGLGDPDMLVPPTDGDWTRKVQIYTCSLARKHCATLDAFSAHFRGQDRLPAMLEEARQQYYELLLAPPSEAFIWDDSRAAQEEEQRKHPQGHNSEASSLEMAYFPSPGWTVAQPSRWGNNPPGAPSAAPWAAAPAGPARPAGPAQGPAPGFVAPGLGPAPSGRPAW